MFKGSYAHTGSVTTDSLHTVDLVLASHIVANVFVEAIATGDGYQATRAAGLEDSLAWSQVHMKGKSGPQGKLTFNEYNK